MSWKKLYKPIVIASIFSLLLSINAAEKSHIQSFVNKYCIDCHGAKKKKASVSFADADFKFEKHASVYFWQDTLDVLNVGEMPPEDEDQPSREELKNVTGLIEIACKNQETQYSGEHGMKIYNVKQNEL